MKSPPLQVVGESSSKEEFNSIGNSCGEVPHPTSKPFVNLETELPESLFSEMKEFLKANPNWDQYSLMSSALANFLFQNGCEDRAVRDRYLSDLFSSFG